MKPDESALDKSMAALFVEADDVGGVEGVQVEACACTDRVDHVSSSCHSSATLACSASDGRHELHVGLRVGNEDDAAQLQHVLNESASTS